MAKQQVSMTIDANIAEEFSRIWPNERSSYCNEMMRLRISSSKGDISGVKLDLLLIKEKETKEKSGILNSELVNITEQIRIFKDQQNKQDQQKLQKEQIRLEAMTKCDGCGVQMTEAHLKEGGEQFCKECFYNEHPKIRQAFKRGNQK